MAERVKGVTMRTGVKKKRKKMRNFRHWQGGQEWIWEHSSSPNQEYVVFVDVKAMDIALAMVKLRSHSRSR
jgi:hypothetical protein